MTERQRELERVGERQSNRIKGRERKKKEGGE